MATKVYEGGHCRTVPEQPVKVKPAPEKQAAPAEVEASKK